MSFRESFSNEQWETLQLSFAWVFELIAGADSKIDNKEKDILHQFISKSHKVPTDLAPEVLASIEGGLDGLMALRANDSRKAKEGLANVKSLLDLQMPHDVGVDFKKVLVTFGYMVGKSSGSIFDDNFSHDEEHILREIGFTLGIQVPGLFQTRTIQDIIDKFFE